MNWNVILIRYLRMTDRFRLKKKPEEKTLYYFCNRCTSSTPVVCKDNGFIPIQISCNSCGKPSTLSFISNDQDPDSKLEFHRPDQNTLKNLLNDEAGNTEIDLENILNGHLILKNIKKESYEL